MTGEDLHRRLREFAAAQGRPLNDVVLPLAAKPKQWLLDLSMTAKPLPWTVKRIEALLAGQPIPERPARVLKSRQGMRNVRSGRVTAVGKDRFVLDPPVPAVPPIPRDPCRQCGQAPVNGMCEHLQRMWG